MKKLFFIIAALFIHMNVWSQRFSHYGIEAGLPCSFVVDVAVDRYDRIWVATDNGLNLYDGTKFTTFSTQNSPISSNGLNSILYDNSSDQLWIATKTKVSAINCKTLHFIDVEEPSQFGFQFITKAADGCIWAACRGDGLIKYSSDGKILEQKNSSSLYNIPGSFISVYDDNGRLYIGSVFDGMSVVDLKKGEAKRFVHDDNDIHSLPGNQVYDFCRDHYGRLWIGTDHGLALFDESEGTFYNFKHDPNNDNSLIADHIYSLEELNNGELWISTDIGGISVLPLQNVNISSPNNVFFQNIKATNNDYGLSSSNIRKVVEDRFGNFWIANYGSGLSCLQHTDARFRKIMEVQHKDISFHKSVRGLFFDIENDELWAGSDNEVIVFDKNFKVIHNYELSDYLVRPNGKVYCINKYKDKYYFGVRDNGLLEFNPKSKRFSRIDFGDYVDVNALWPDDNNVLWIGTQVGVYCYNNKEIFKEPKITSRLGNASVFGFNRDKNNNLWINTFGFGISIFDRELNYIKSPSVSKKELSGNINCSLIVDRDNNIWVSSQNGITKFNAGECVGSEFIGFEEGLQDEMIHAIAEDDFGNIWIGSDRGISSYNPSSKEIQNYSYKDGIPYGNIQHSSVTKDNDGNIYFGTHNGICVFTPKSILAQDVCSDIRIQQYSTEGDELYFSFCIADEAQRDIVDYYYRIIGLSNEWTNIGGQTSVSFHGLASGNYTFEVKAILRNTKDSETKTDSRRFYIAPPIWKSWWAYLIYTLLLMLIITYIFYSYKRKILLQSSLEIARRNNINEQHLNREKLKFFTNITHELRTPLTLIIGPLEDMKIDNSLPSNILRKVEVMHSNASQLLNLVNEILEFRKTETENRQLTVEKCRLSDIVKETWIRFKESNRNEAVKFVIDIAEDDAILVDTNAIKTILNNLLSNSIKYTSKGEIGVSLKMAGDNAIIKVSDTGLGISEKDLPHIYDRYYQPENDRQQTGTGIGLAVVKALAELHKAKLEVESKENIGTVFSITLCTKESYPDAIHKESSSKENVTISTLVTSNDTKRKDKIILVVDDNEDIRNYISNSFKEKYKTVLATNGLDGLNKAKNILPDIIISDIMMPQMDGITMCQKLKNDISTSHIPIILLTAKDTLEDQAEGYETGADAYLTKPFSARLLMACIQSQLEQMERVSSYLSKNMTTGPVKIENTKLDIPNVSKIDVEFIEKLNNVIYERMSNNELSINDICEELGFSHSTLYRKVKALTDLSINEYIRKQRLLNAKELLRNSGHNVSEVAYMCGFSDLGYFITCFKKEFNATPSTYKKN